MATVDRSQISCGVYQLYGLRPYSSVILKRLMAGYKHQANAQGRRRGFAQVIFSDAVLNRLGRDCNGERFMKYLQKHFPGIKFTKLVSKNSPSTGNTIATWVVDIPHPAFRRHKFYSAVKPQMHFQEVQERIQRHRWPY